MDTVNELNAAYERCMAALGNAATEPDLSQRAFDAYSAYAARLPDVSKVSAVIEMNDAFEAYREIISGGFRGAEAGDRIRAAYRTYLAELQAAWVDSDPKELSPADLAAIGRSLAFLGWLVEAGLDGARSAPEAIDVDTLNSERGSSLWGSTSVLSDPDGR
jgi:hypothetical protein